MVEDWIEELVRAAQGVVPKKETVLEWRAAYHHSVSKRTVLTRRSWQGRRCLRDAGPPLALASRIFPRERLIRGAGAVAEWLPTVGLIVGTMAVLVGIVVGGAWLWSLIPVATPTVVQVLEPAATVAAQSPEDAMLSVLSIASKVAAPIMIGGFLLKLLKGDF